MTHTNQSYRGVDIVPLIYVHKDLSNSGRHNYDTLFDASVKVFVRRLDTEDANVRVFVVSETGRFTSTGDARRASVDFAQRLIDRECQSDAAADAATSEQ